MCGCLLGLCLQPAGCSGVSGLVRLQHVGMIVFGSEPAIHKSFDMTHADAWVVLVHAMRVLHSLWPVLASGFSDLVQRGEVQAAANAENKQRMEAIKDLAHKLQLRLVRAGAGGAAGTAGRTGFQQGKSMRRCRRTGTAEQKNSPVRCPCVDGDLCLPTCLWCTGEGACRARCCHA